MLIVTEIFVEIVKHGFNLPLNFTGLGDHVLAELSQKQERIGLIFAVDESLSFGTMS